jgi:hypothetical protein
MSFPTQDDRLYLTSKVKYKSLQYNDFLLENESGYFELTFYQMQQVFWMQGMERWKDLMDGLLDYHSMHLSFVAFDPKKDQKGDNRHKVLKGQAKLKAKKMLSDCFIHRSRDQGCISNCLSNFPTAGIYMTLIDTTRKKRDWYR